MIKHQSNLVITKIIKPTTDFWECRLDDSKGGHVEIMFLY